ncbi:hypothetical protein BACEGG_01151 [Bacteroides eggerthii DSM 20697]|nr:hypothetical protein BACEGG_01151 [Bacteroides eggerthii DSM 20697]
MSILFLLLILGFGRKVNGLCASTMGWHNRGSLWQRVAFSELF